MKLSIDNQVDSLYLKFNDNKVAETIEIEQEIFADIDSNNKVVGLEVLHYSKLKEWTKKLLLDNDLSTLEEDEITFYMHQGYDVAWFRKKDINKQEVFCSAYLEGDNITKYPFQCFLQDLVDFTIKHS